jgi:L-alanine-DL-glutamate epimerase-like enolase superfamily enzyme
MKLNRRGFLKHGSFASFAFIPSISCNLFNRNDSVLDVFSEIDKVLLKPVIDKTSIKESIIIQSLELKRYKNNFICEVISTRGQKGISVGNSDKLQSLWPIFYKRLQPFIIGKDARDLENILESIYVYKSNYKLQNLALWVPWATIEFAILDLIGKVEDKSIGKIIGEIYNPKISVYRANNFRGKSAEESIELIKENVFSSQAKAVKFKIGGRMSKNKDFPIGRSEKLIPLVRKTFGDDMKIYADSNGSYDVKEAIRLGKILEEYNYDFYEEPVPFDWYEETKEVTKSLSVPIAGGEQEASMRNFRWLIGNRALDIVQPDMFYFGGIIRSIKVARMAKILDIPCVPHISGNGLGYLYMMHFVSAIPNAGQFHEFKGFNNQIPLECSTSKLKSDGGVVKVPTGAGLGVEIDPDFIKKHKVTR